MTFRPARIVALCVAVALPAIASAAPFGAARGGGAMGGDAIERMRAADTNHDGVVSRGEMLAMRKSEWHRFDRNGDGYFSQDDLPGFVRDRWNSGRLAQMRESFDANHDGRISQAEFTAGPTPAFDMADANHDGRITEAEFKAAAAAVKAARE